MARQKRGAQQVRIIGGKWKGRKLRFSGDAGLRPTPARMRETLFNWLRAEITDMRCLDAFAGSGALGFEALSQGASRVVFVEHNPRTVRSLQDTVRELQAEEQASIVKGDLLGYLKKAGESFDLVFLDPPFAQSYLSAVVLELLQQRGLVRGYVYVECPDVAAVKQIAEQLGMVVAKETRAGDSSALLLSPG
jgi:16S rRNA (guanine966-N2)-methyltransferase